MSTMPFRLPIPVLARIMSGLAAAFAFAFVLSLASANTAQAQTCSGGQVPLDGTCVTPAAKCTGRGWDHYSEGGEYAGLCTPSIWEIGGGSSGSCDLHSGGSCYSAFGPDLDFPPYPGSDPFYIYNCDPDGTRGLIPATSNNRDGETECRCANPTKIRKGATSAGFSVGGFSPLVGGVCECPDGATEIPRGDTTECVSVADQKTPKLTRVVSADFASETFTYHWGPPENFGETVVGYHIRRQQNNPSAVLSQNHHPTDCDALTNAQYRWSDNNAAARTDYSFLTGGIIVSATVFSRAEQASATRDSYGNCYRWHISAFSASAAGPTVVTDPILSRPNTGRGGCPAQQGKPWAGGNTPYAGACVSQDRLEGPEWCARIGGTLTAGDTQCQTPAGVSCESGGFAEASASLCNINSGGLCQTNERYNLDHRECLCQGWATPKSGGSGCECAVDNADSLCECPLGSVYSPESNSCGCPAGLTAVAAGDATVCLPAAAAQIAQDCGAAGWDVVLDGGVFCGAPFHLYGDRASGGNSGAKCLFHGSASGVDCADIYGDPPKFPSASAHPDVVGGSERFRANCDLYGAAPGGFPPHQNLNGETECSCDRYSPPDAVWPDCRPALVDYDYLKLHCPFGGNFPRQESGGYEVRRTTNNTVIGALCFFATSPIFRGCIGVEPAHARAPRSEFWNPDQSSYFGTAWDNHDIGICDDWLTFCPDGMADEDGNFFTQDDCAPAPSFVFEVSEPRGATIIAEWKAAGITANLYSGASLPVVAATVSLQLTLAAGWEHLEWQGDCAAFAVGEGCLITTAMGGKTALSVGARLEPPCPRGTVRNAEFICEDAPPEVKCAQFDWETEGEPATGCQIPNYDPIADALEDSCSFTLGGDGTLPGCEQVFGDNLNFPLNPDPTADLADLSAYLYNCDPNGTRGLLPATANTVSATNCSCADSAKLRIGEDTFDVGGDGNAIYTRSACVDDAAEAGAQDCVEEFWDLSAENGGKCVLPLSQGGTLSLSGCFLSGEAEPQCDEIFPVDNLGDIQFPFHLELGEGEGFVFNCGAGRFPQVNAEGETECVGGDDARIKTGLAACDDKGWLDDALNEKCEISTALRGTLNAATECFFSGASQPQCADIFGPDFDFPENPDAETPPTYAYNCDPDGTTGLLPATFADGKELCECSGFGKSVDESGMCVCAAGETASPVADFCVADSIIADVRKCENAGWVLTGHPDGAGGELFQCIIGFANVSRNISRNTCEFTELSSVVNCADVFENSEFPTRPETGVAPYLYNCDPDGDSGLLPATFASSERESCKCPSGLTYVGDINQLPYTINSRQFMTPYGGACVSPEVAEGLEKCHEGNWDISDEGGGKCVIPLVEAEGSESATVFAGCFVGGDLEPQCADVFGSGLSFPTAGATEVTFAFNCGATMTPESVNLNGATSCECALEDDNGNCICGGGQTLSGGACVCPSDGSVHDLGEACIPTEATDENFDTVTGGEEELCARFGGMASDEGNGRVCNDLDEAGTFCILDSAGDDPAFPCRGLFKHLRRCNGEYDRRALNPFICGQRCDNGARGRNCL